MKYARVYGPIEGHFAAGYAEPGHIATDPLCNYFVRKLCNQQPLLQQIGNPISIFLATN